MDHRRSHSQSAVKTFDSRQALKNYTIRTNKIFPKSIAKKDPLVKILLREVFVSDAWTTLK